MTHFATDCHNYGWTPILWHLRKNPRVVFNFSQFNGPMGTLICCHIYVHSDACLLQYMEAILGCRSPMLPLCGLLHHTNCAQKRSTKAATAAFLGLFLAHFSSIGKFLVAGGPRANYVCDRQRLSTFPVFYK